MENQYDFCITARKWQKAVLWIFLILGIAGTVVISVLLGLKRIPDIHRIWLLLSIFFIVIGAIGVYAACVEKFTLRNETFRYVKPFKKAQSANIADVAKVVVRPKGGLFVDVIFFDRNEKKLIHFYDDGTAFTGNYLQTVLDAYHIPFYIENRNG